MRYENLLVEIGTEELPPKALSKLAQAFADNVQAALDDAELKYTSVKWFASPRRLAVNVIGLAQQQEDKSIEKKGPAVSVAFDDTGQATKAAQGWARSNGITVEQAERLTTEKGEWLLFKGEVKGEQAATLIPAMIEGALKKLPIPKPMRWGSSPIQFIRPVHTVCMLFGEEIVNGNILGIASDRVIYGHRFHGEKQFNLTHADNYLEQLEAHYVLADFAARKAKIKQQVTTTAEQENALADMSDALLDEVTALVEWPVVLTASFDESFLAVPKEALIYTMKDDQKYFPLLDKDGQLKSRFVFVTNIESKDAYQIISGNEKVIRPRLADAEFFFNTDKKNTLESRLESLKTVLFQKQLGTLYEKSLRISELAGNIASMLGSDTTLAARAGLLSKTDLMTNMVMEFPDVQGVMGMHYAKFDGEHNEVALAQNEQYMPRFAGDQLPTSHISCAVALADKIDSLVGIFGIGQVPKGDKDPFALRRAAIGVLRIIVEMKLPLDLTDLVRSSISLFGDKLTQPEDLETKVVDFILGRFRAWYQEQGIDVDVIQAVAARRPTKPADFAARIEAVSGFKSLASGLALASANKRVANILAKNKVTDTAAIEPSLFENEHEKGLAEALESIEESVSVFVNDANYQGVFAELATLHVKVDNFFDNVMVMAEDERIRNNRLALLSKLRMLFLLVADISILNQQ
ncbi:glycine--tRNA ligase subunit beta [Paraglaciecola polaris]|uniref:Glycine--tRNA ligase beta subunit n=1 Tax=Paraglaciecola polaris LMG 21857 TaxID=1129793 RepID=K7A6R5_9ALTE|nr:glycine--tRNA ligase subunit beta [Paraglaciecola polaris]GAC31145.1 glycyl-tRNA synthetase beta chain [Paraglaciecola polaris LMG 21857]|tara:strand:+ start:24168 stop:26243 length:2076 start_codon:yes stop_codon:yes gene_type:complete